MGARKADFAGSWYPGNESDCIREIEAFLQAGIPCPDPKKSRFGGIVPHAGWFYSGKIACGVIHCLKNDSSPDLVVIFGRHLQPDSGNIIMKGDIWTTPLGDLEIDNEFGEKLTSEFPFKIETESKYEQDNTIELQLPFIKYFFPNTKILPIGVPPKLPSLKIGERAAEISREMGRKTIFLGSTDLTHYGTNYGYSPKGGGEEAVNWVKNENDRRIVDLMLGMDAGAVIGESLKNSNACCSGAAATAIAAAKKSGASEGEELLYHTSYDVRPDNSFVGYVGIVFHN